MLKLIKKPKKDKKPQSEIWLLVGLGNPGEGYKHNRHNIGFMAVDEIAAAHKFPPFKMKFEGWTAEAMLDGHKTILLKPKTYMNNSGQSVKAAAKFYKVAHERIVVFHDELDLSPFKVRVKYGGGNAGHNGLRSIEEHFGTPDFWRVRLGIGHPGEREKVHGHVLKDFAKGEKSSLDLLLKAIGEHAQLIVQNEISAFTSRIGAAVPKSADDKKESKKESKQDNKHVGLELEDAPPVKAAGGKKKEK